MGIKERSRGMWISGDEGESAKECGSLSRGEPRRSQRSDTRKKDDD